VGRRKRPPTGRVLRVQHKGELVMTDDDFFNGLEELLRSTARSSSVLRFDGAPMTQVDLVVELQHVSRVLGEHCRQVLVDGAGRWLEISELLHAASKSCRNEAVLEEDQTAAEGTVIEATPEGKQECPFSPSGRHQPEVSNPNKCAFCGASL